MSLHQSHSLLRLEPKEHWNFTHLPHLLVQALPPSMSHITSLKHLIDLQLCRSSQSAARATSHGEFTDNEAEFCCPVTGLPFNGTARFMVLPKNGFVVSEKALKQVCGHALS